MTPEPTKPGAPRPGLDYYVEAGRYVFTAAYLKSRGWCCGNGCRHCPYRDDEKREQSMRASTRP